MLYSLPFIKHVSGKLKVKDLATEIYYARNVINASRYPQPNDFHIDTIPVFLISREDMDLLCHPKKKVDPLHIVAERIVASVLECIFSKSKDNKETPINQEYYNPINRRLEYVVCEANVSCLTQEERDDLAEVVCTLIGKIKQRIVDIIIEDEDESLENVIINDRRIERLAIALLPSFAKFLGSWMQHDNEDCTTKLSTILRKAFKARKSCVTLGLYCSSNPSPGTFFKETPNDYNGPIILLCPDRICRDKTARMRSLAFAKTMVHEFCHAYMDVSDYGSPDNLHHCIEESYANALTLRVFETFAFETNNYLSGIGKKSTLTIVKELMEEQPRDYALGVPLFEKHTYFPERWRTNKAKVAAATGKVDYLNIVYLCNNKNLCTSNILRTINDLL